MNAEIYKSFKVEGKIITGGGGEVRPLPEQILKGRVAVNQLNRTCSERAGATGENLVRKFMFQEKA